MSENKIIEIEEEFISENLKINPTWTPLNNGEIFKILMISLTIMRAPQISHCQL